MLASFKWWGWSFWWIGYLTHSTNIIWDNLGKSLNECFRQNPEDILCVRMESGYISIRSPPLFLLQANQISVGTFPLSRARKIGEFSTDLFLNFEERQSYEEKNKIILLFLPFTFKPIRLDFRSGWEAMGIKISLF